MSIPANIEIIYYDNGKVSKVIETNKAGDFNGKTYEWDDKGELWAEWNYNNGQLNGVSRVWTDKKCTLYYYQNSRHLTDRIKGYVKDLNNISLQEKTIIAMATGIIL